VAKRGKALIMRAMFAFYVSVIGLCLLAAMLVALANG
jgi:hypothetical protein